MQPGETHTEDRHFPRVMADVLEMVAITMEQDDPSAAIVETAQTRFYGLHSCHIKAALDLLWTLFQAQAVSAEGVRHLRKNLITHYHAD